MPQKGITVYLPRDLEVRVERIARDQHRSASSVITEAVRKSLGGHSANQPAPETVAQRYASRLDSRLEKVIGEELVIKEVLLSFIRVWLEHNPPIPEELEDSAAASAEARFERFIEMVANALKPGGHSIAHAVIAPGANGEDNRDDAGAEA